MQYRCNQQKRCANHQRRPESTFHHLTCACAQTPRTLWTSQTRPRETPCAVARRASFWTPDEHKMTGTQPPVKEPIARKKQIQIERGADLQQLLKSNDFKQLSSAAVATSQPSSSAAIFSILSEQASSAAAILSRHVLMSSGSTSTSCC